MRRLLMLGAMALLTGCGGVSSRPCPFVTEFPPALQSQAADELLTAPALREMVEAMNRDRAANRAICLR